LLRHWNEETWCVAAGRCISYLGAVGNGAETSLPQFLTAQIIHSGFSYSLKEQPAVKRVLRH
jgi:hypothetical protein